MTATITHTAAIAEDRPLRALHTPYHSLGSGTGPLVPGWAQHRSVYRGDGRTLYLVETTRLGEAGADLQHLVREGWDVQVERLGTAAEARIALSRSDLAQAA